MAGNERVAVLGTGGLSHFVVDEELDRQVLKAFQEKDDNLLKVFPANDSRRAPRRSATGSPSRAPSSIWTSTFSTTSPATAPRHGTGCAMGFARWA